MGLNDHEQEILAAIERQFYEEDPELARARLAVFQIFARGLRAMADLLGLPEPERM